MMIRPTIFEVLTQGEARPLVRLAIPSVRKLITRRALSNEKAESLYRHLWLTEAASWTQDEQRDFALGYFMASMDSEDVLLMPPNCGAFTQTAGKHLPTDRRRLAYKCGIAFAIGEGSDQACGIVRGAAFAFGMNPCKSRSATAQLVQEYTAAHEGMNRFNGSILTRF